MNYTPDEWIQIVMHGHTSTSVLIDLYRSGNEPLKIGSTRGQGGVGQPSISTIRNINKRLKNKGVRFQIIFLQQESVVPWSDCKIKLART